MKCIVPVGGSGTRLYPLTKDWMKKIQNFVCINGFIYITMSIILMFAFSYHIDGLFSYKTDLPSARTVIQMENGQTYSETLQPFSDDIRSLKIKFGTNCRTNDGLLTLRLIEGNSEIRKWEISTGELLDNAFQVFEMGCPYITKQDEPITLEITNNYESGTDNNIAVYISNDGIINADGNAIQGSFVKQWTLVNHEQTKRYKPLYISLAVVFFLILLFTLEFQRIKWPRLVLITIGCLFIIQFVDYDLFENINTRVFFKSWQNNEEKIEIKPSEEKTFSCGVNHSVFTGIELFFEEKPEQLFVEIKRSVDQFVVFNGIVTNSFDDGRTWKYGVIIEPRRRFSPGDYSIRIINQGNSPIQLYGAEDGSINAYIWKRTYIAHMLFSACLFILSYGGIAIFIVSSKKCRFKYLYLTMSIPLSFVYLIMFVPWSQPDTGLHYLAAYRHSNMILGIDENLGRQEDAEFYYQVWGRDTNPSILSYSGVVHNLHLRCRKPDLVEMPQIEKMNYYSMINYFPEALGISLGRVLNLNIVLCQYIGRFFILFTYLAICYYSVARTPVGKGIMAMVSLLPMSLMMASTISYDPLAIAVSLAFIASILYLKKYSTSKKGIVEAIIWSFLLGSIKGGGYIVLLPIVLMLYKKEHRAYTNMIIISVAGIISLLIFDIVIPRGNLFQLGEKGNDNLFAAYAFQHPLRFINLSLESYIINTDHLIINTGGTHLAWLEWSMPDMVVVLLYVLGGLYSLYEEDEMSITKRDSIIMMIVVGVGVIGVSIMLLSFTKIGSRAIAGLQGRYYLPFVPLLFIGLLKKWRFQYKDLCASKQHDLSKVWKCFYAISILGIYYFSRIYLTR